MIDLHGLTVGVVGLGDSGLSAARWLARRGVRLVVADSRPTPPHQAELAGHAPDAELRCGPFDASSFAGCDLLVVSPGVPLATAQIVAFAQAGGQVIGDVELFAQALAGQRSRVIAITGSNGKTTVTSLVGHLCQHAGLNTVVAGNIGLPVLDALCDIEDSGIWPEVFVLELSSFQLEGVRSLRADAATVLNISEDHLDRYQDLLDYAHSKTAIFAGDGVQVINQDDVFCRAMVRPGRAVRRFSLTQPAQYGLCRDGQAVALAVDGTPVLDFASLQLTGLHNAANALAALALCEAIGLDRARLLAGLCSFKGLAHRVEHVLQLNGVDFYDDSKGTNVGATEAALNGMTRPVVLIAGGDGKGQDFSPLAPAVARIARAVLLIGRDAGQIEAALAGVSVPVQRVDTLEEATRLAYAAAQPGDVVLLSPACASLDMFRNYAHRAEVFIASARQLADEAHP